MSFWFSLNHMFTMNCEPHRAGCSKSPRASRIKLVICECSWCTIQCTLFYRKNPFERMFRFDLKVFSLYIGKLASTQGPINRIWLNTPEIISVNQRTLPVDHRQDVNGVDDDGLPLVYSVERTLGRSRKKSFRIFRSSEWIIPIPIINEHYSDRKHDLGPQKVAEVLVEIP